MTPRDTIRAAALIVAEEPTHWTRLPVLPSPPTSEGGGNA